MNEIQADKRRKRNGEGGSSSSSSSSSSSNNNVSVDDENGNIEGVCGQLANSIVSFGDEYADEKEKMLQLTGKILEIQKSVVEIQKSKVGVLESEVERQKREIEELKREGNRWKFKDRINGELAYDKLTAFEMWREILMFV